MNKEQKLIEECKKHLRDTEQYKLEYKKDIRKLITALEKQLTLTDVVKSLPQDNYCNVCNLPSDGEKCYSKRCPV